MNLLLAAIFLTNVTVTAYRSVESQTDSTPYIAADEHYVSPYGIAISRDLWRPNGGPLEFGDMVYIDEVGFKMVNDLMGETECIQWKNKQCVKRHQIIKQIDVWVDTRDKEAAVWKKFAGRKVRIWKIRKENSQ